MPIPVPSDKESKEDFIARCMGSDVMKSEFPDDKQRFAVCQSKWTSKKKKDAEQEEIEKHQHLPEQLLEKAVRKINDKE